MHRDPPIPRRRIRPPGAPVQPGKPSSAPADPPAPETPPAPAPGQARGKSRVVEAPFPFPGIVGGADDWAEAQRQHDELLDEALAGLVQQHTAAGSGVVAMFDGWPVDNTDAPAGG